MQKVLVTGVNGFVGQHLLRELSAHNIAVIGVNGPRGASNTDAHDFEYITLDLRDPVEVQKIDFSVIDGVIHLAGLAAVGPSFDKPMQYIETNIGIETNLFEAALKQGARPKFLIISTGALYDPNAPLPLTEASATLSSSPYAVSKVGQEEMAHYYGRRGLECVIARPFNHFGPGQELGFIVPDLTKQVVDVENSRADAVMVGNLDAKRDYTDVRDIARAYRLLLEKGRTGEIYNICSGKALSGHEIFACISKVAGSQPVVKEDPAKMRPSDVAELYGSHEKLTQDTDWQPEIATEQTLVDVVTYWREQA